MELPEIENGTTVLGRTPTVMEFMILIYMEFFVLVCILAWECLVQFSKPLPISAQQGQPNQL
jgi:hypothetical protein